MTLQEIEVWTRQVVDKALSGQPSEIPFVEDALQAVKGISV